jgi:hypothetical protein
MCRSPVCLILRHLPSRADGRLVTFVNEASGEWGDDSVHENDLPFATNALTPNESPGRQRDSLSEITAEDGSSILPHSNQHGPELAHTSSPPMPCTDEAPILSLREAFLMRCFIQKIAPWVSNTHSTGAGEGHGLTGR